MFPGSSDSLSQWLHLNISKYLPWNILSWRFFTEFRENFVWHIEQYALDSKIAWLTLLLTCSYIWPSFVERLFSSKFCEYFLKSWCVSSSSFVADLLLKRILWNIIIMKMFHRVLQNFLGYVWIFWTKQQCGLFSILSLDFVEATHSQFSEPITGSPLAIKCDIEGMFDDSHALNPQLNPKQKAPAAMIINSPGFCFTMVNLIPCLSKSAGGIMQAQLLFKSLFKNVSSFSACDFGIMIQYFGAPYSRKFTEHKSLPSQ